MILVHASPTTLAPYRTENLGILCSPRRVYGEEMQGWPWAADNDAFSKWNEERYGEMLQRIEGREGCLFVTCPDVVGDSAATLDLFYEWWPALRRRKLPIALVAQDGLTPEDVPWPVIDCLFIGGTTDWKLGTQATRLVREAKERGKWIHMGRVNSRIRTRHARIIGCDSIDGTQFSWFRDTKLPSAPQARGQQVFAE